MSDYSTAFFNLINDFAFIIELDEQLQPKKILKANTFACDRMGFTCGEIENELFIHLFDPIPNSDEFKRIVEKFSEETFVASVKTKEDIWVDLDIKTHIISEGNKKHGLMLARDITEYKRFEEEFNYINEELINQRENFQALIDNLTQTQEQLVQSEKMAALGQLIAGVAHEINTPLGAIKASVGNMNTSLHKTINILPEIINSLDSKGKQLFVDVLQFSDLEAASQLSSREKRKIRRELAVKFSELNIEGAENLADVCIYLHIHHKIDELLPRFVLPDLKEVLDAVKNLVSIEKNTSTISMAVEKAHKVVFALKKFVHQDTSGEKSPTDIVDSIETVLTLYSNQMKQGINLVKEFDELPPVACYADEINQVWTNLIHNAVQAMGQEGTLTVRAKIVANELVVEIGDTGCGIEPDIQNKIFDPFFTTKKSGEGSGIGLDIVKKIIDKHEGEITFESVINEGTTFKVLLPIEN